MDARNPNFPLLTATRLLMFAAVLVVASSLSTSEGAAREATVILAVLLLAVLVAAHVWTDARSVEMDTSGKWSKRDASTAVIFLISLLALTHGAVQLVLVGVRADDIGRFEAIMRRGAGAAATLAGSVGVFVAGWAGCFGPRSGDGCADEEGADVEPRVERRPLFPALFMRREPQA